jgi:hypothetical protein
VGKSGEVDDVEEIEGGDETTTDDVGTPYTRPFHVNGPRDGCPLEELGSIHFLFSIKSLKQKYQNKERYHSYSNNCSKTKTIVKSKIR